MNDPSNRRVSYQEYLRLEGLQGELRYQYLDGEMLAMSDPSRAHECIVSNFSEALGPPVRARGCRYFTRGAVWCETRNSELKPDWLVVCDERDLLGRGDEMTRSRYRFPTFLVEVLSPSNSAAEMQAKLSAYSALASIETYLVVNSTRQQVWRYVRTSHGLVPSDSGDLVETPFGALTWKQLYRDAGVAPLSDVPVQTPPS